MIDTDPTRLEIVWEETHIRRVTLTTNEIRDIFGLNGTAAEHLVKRLVALAAYDPSILNLIEQSGTGPTVKRDGPYTPKLRELNRHKVGDAAEFVELSDVTFYCDTPGPHPAHHVARPDRAGHQFCRGVPFLERSPE